MEKFTTCLLLFLVVGHLLQEVIGERQCSTSGKNGIGGCECNIMDACDEHGNLRSNWAQYLPANVEQFGLAERVQNLAYLCERSTVAMLYDCNNRIPLYAATVITGKQLSDDSIGRPPSKFRKIEKRNQLDNYFQQKDADYKHSSQRELCYKTNSNRYIIDYEWLRSSGNANNLPNSNVCPGGATWLRTEIHKGHLIASQDGRGDRARMVATFTYTNAVPQFGPFNQGPWQVCETKLIKWGQDYCAVEGAQNVQMFIVVGAIPSTNFGRQKTRYFGRKGFSDYKDKDDYPVNVPRYMWTAACCKYNDNGTWKYHSTAFYRQNHPGVTPCDKLDVRTLLRNLFGWLPRGWFFRWFYQNIKLFPHTPQCDDRKNFIPLP